MLEGLNDKARQVVARAHAEAARLRHSYFGTEHLLLGLIAETDSSASRILIQSAVSYELIRQSIIETIGMGAETRPEPLPSTPRARKVLALALPQALQLGQSSIGTHHILLALMVEGDGVGAEVLLRLLGDFSSLRESIITQSSELSRAEAESSPKQQGED